jgi:hypothetical protein
MLHTCARAQKLAARRYPGHSVHVTPTRIERWGHYNGLLLDVLRPGRGRAKGRAANYSAQYVERLAEVAVRIRRGQALYRTALWLFADEILDDEPVIRRAYGEALDDLKENLTRSAERAAKELGRDAQAPTKPTGADYADLIEDELAKHLRTIQGGGKTKRQTAAHLIGRIIFGEPIDIEELAQYLIAVGVPAEIVKDRDALRDVAGPLERVYIDAQRRVAQEASIEELREFCDTARGLQREALTLSNEHLPELQQARGARIVFAESGFRAAMGGLMIGAIKRSSLS